MKSYLTDDDKHDALLPDNLPKNREIDTVPGVLSSLVYSALLIPFLLQLYFYYYYCFSFKGILRGAPKLAQQIKPSYDERGMPEN